MSTLLWPDWPNARRKLTANVAVDVVVEIGVSHARFACVEQRRLCRQRVLICHHFPSFAAAFLSYCRIYGIAPRCTVVSVAAPVLTDWVVLPYAPWSFSAAETHQLLGLDQLLVLNDFEALAFAIPRLTRRQLLPLGGTEPIVGAVKAVMGPGEGLGMATVLPTPHDWLVMATEGGHASFAPNSDREWQLATQWREMLDEHVSLEQVLSTAGLARIHRTLMRCDGVKASALNAFQIGRRALAGDHDCRQALDLFCSVLGNAAGNLALTVGARGGVYLGGPMLPRIRDYVAASPFRSAFENKGRFRDYLASIPVWIINEPRANLLGAAARLTQLRPASAHQQEYYA